MEKYTFDTIIKVFGIEVKTFPLGIDEAFKELIKKTGNYAGERNYYGISSMSSDGKIIYIAAAEQKNEGEAEKYNYSSHTIEKGEYLYEVLKNWRDNTNCIKDIFHKLMQNDQVNKQKPCVEWYRNDEEMLCMVKAL